MADPYEHADALPDGHARGRGAQLNPGNRYEAVRLHVLGEHLDRIAVDEDESREVRTEVFRDRSKSLINPVDSPDLPFKWSINPYRGCEHGCVYCYARPDHERLGFSCGLEFETKILAKVDAPALLRKELSRPSWVGEPIMMAGVTDCYQPIERKLRITRQCLEIMTACRQPVSIVTKNRLVVRDVDLLKALAKHGAARVAVSVTTLDAKLSAAMEPRASSPGERLDAIRRLSDAGVPVAVMVAPVIPGLNDRQMPDVLRAAADAGATSAGYVMLRLPHQIKTLFADWLGRHCPDRAGRVMSLVRQMHGGRLYDSTFRHRQRGSGAVAEQIGQMFDVLGRRFGLRNVRQCGQSLRSAAFERPSAPDRSGQMNLFSA